MSTDHIATGLAVLAALALAAAIVRQLGRMLWGREADRMDYLESCEDDDLYYQ